MATEVPENIYAINERFPIRLQSVRRQYRYLWFLQDLCEHRLMNDELLLVESFGGYCIDGLE